MPKANPSAWFTSPVAKIAYKKVNKWAEYSARFHPYFPTWKEAYDWMLAKAEERLKRAKAELKSAEAHIKKIRAMQEPAAHARDKVENDEA